MSGTAWLPLGASLVYSMCLFDWTLHPICGQVPWHLCLARLRLDQCHAHPCSCTPTLMKRWCSHPLLACFNLVTIISFFPMRPPSLLHFLLPKWNSMHSTRPLQPDSMHRNRSSVGRTSVSTA
ncbi:hypothetical protein BDP27DRAFT_543269 [Rhodocollybia butyracea]|uniref:Secreted protein n=1 Tax=Rhodocollybia butyracea TaxID=206335 RepID=A0A9P5P9P2_9AGAR|nr:hypothetical protein BDP27DRAFT_543269 [Rhodocollybia butyracea]